MKAFFRPPRGRRLHDFLKSKTANAAIIFCIAALPLIAATGVAIDYARIQSQMVHLQKAIDSAALATVPAAASLTSANLSTLVQERVSAGLGNRTLSDITIGSSYDATSRVLTVTANGSYPNTFTRILGQPSVHIRERAQATVTKGLLPVCAMVLSPAAKHTLYTSDTATMSFDNCILQVNTNDSDAVEAESTSKIQNTNGENCFVGDIHFGDVSPAKDPSCTMLVDPFGGYAMPASAAGCSFTDRSFVTNGSSLLPGTYCGTTTISATNVSLQPGLYIVRDGDFIIKDSDVTATGVTFVLTGTDPTLSIVGTSNVKQTPSTSGPGGTFAGFAVYLDSAARLSNCGATDGKKILAGSGPGAGAGPGAGPGAGGGPGTGGGPGAGAGRPGAAGHGAGGRGAGSGGASAGPGGGSAGAGTTAAATSGPWPMPCASGVFGTAAYTTSGTIYLANMALVARDSSRLSVQHASILSQYLLASDTAAITVTPPSLSASSAARLQKYSEAASIPRLVR